MGPPPNPPRYPHHAVGTPDPYFWTPFHEQQYVKIDTLPSLGNYKKWQIALRATVCAASGGRDECMRWIMRREARDATQAELAIPGHTWTSLDEKLADAILKLIEKRVPNSQRIALVVRQAADIARLRGRQILRIIYHQYELADSERSIYAIEHLFNLQYNPRAHSPLRSFMYEWKQLCLDIDEDAMPDRSLLLARLRSQG